MADPSVSWSVAAQTTTKVATTAAHTPAAGDLLVVVATWEDDSHAISNMAISDNKSGTWTSKVTDDVPTDNVGRAQIWVRDSTGSDSGLTVTVTGTSADSDAWSFQAVLLGVANAAAAASQTGATANHGTATSPQASITPTAIGSLILGGGVTVYHITGEVSGTTNISSYKGQSSQDSVGCFSASATALTAKTVGYTVSTTDTQSPCAVIEILAAGGSSVTGDASTTVTASRTAAATNSTTAAVSLTETASLTAAATPTRHGAAELDVSATLTAGATKSRTIDGSLTATVSETASATVSAVAGASQTVTAGLTAGATVSYAAAAALTITGSLSSAAVAGAVTDIDAAGSYTASRTATATNSGVVLASLNPQVAFTATLGLAYGGAGSLAAAAGFEAALTLAKAATPGAGLGGVLVLANTADATVTSASATPSLGEATVSRQLADATIGSNQ